MIPTGTTQSFALFMEDLLEAVGTAEFCLRANEIGDLVGRPGGTTADLLTQCTALKLVRTTAPAGGKPSTRQITQLGQDVVQEFIRLGRELPTTDKLPNKNVQSAPHWPFGEVFEDADGWYPNGTKRPDPVARREREKATA